MNILNQFKSIFKRYFVFLLILVYESLSMKWLIIYAVIQLIQLFCKSTQYSELQ